MKMRILATPLAILALGLAQGASAAVHTFDIDPGHSHIGFKIRHIVAKVPGNFGEFSGTVVMDPEKVESTFQVKGTIKAASVDTGVEKRDEHLRSADFFNVEKFPEITFASKKVAKNGDGYDVTGDLTMLGVTKEATLHMDVLGVSKHPFSGMPTAGLELAGKVNRKDFGMEWNKTLDAGALLLGEDVDLSIQLEVGVPAPAEAKK